MPLSETETISKFYEAIFNDRRSLEGVKSAIKSFEKNDSGALERLKASRKDITGQIKEIEDEFDSELREDPEYMEQIELKEKLKEKIALSGQGFKKLINTLPKELKEIQLTVNGFGLKIQIMPDMKFFVNGKEDKLK